MLLAEALPRDVRDCLTDVQHDLFDLGGELSVPGHAIMSAAHVTRLESCSTASTPRLPPLKDFVLPGGIARGGLRPRRARRVPPRGAPRRDALAQADTAPAFAVRYLNRLSDLLFVLARVLNRRAGRGDVLWQQGKNR